MHPSSGVLKPVSATSGVRHGNGTVTSFLRGLIRPRRKEVTVPLPWHTPEVADTVFSTPDDGCVTPETCRVTWQWINVYILLHRVGPLLTLNHDARNHVFKVKETVIWNTFPVLIFVIRWKGKDRAQMRRASYTLSVKLSDFTVWRHTWRKKLSKLRSFDRR